jgi:hypothetical protein
VIVIVCGGREFNDYNLIESTMARELLPGTVVVTGGARGADYNADLAANRLGFQRVIFPANWTQHGKGAGPRRNMMMLSLMKPDLVLAFPGGTGTAHMVRIARESGVRVVEANYGAPAAL